MIHVGLTPEDFDKVMHGWKRQLLVTASHFSESPKSGDIARVGIKDHGTGKPTIDCIVTHVEDCAIATVHPDSGEILTAVDSAILSITRGIKW